MSKYKMAPVYIGDVGEIPAPQNEMELMETKVHILQTDLSQLDFRALCNLAVQIGIDIRDLIGVQTCSEHMGMIFLGDKPMPAGYNLFDHCTYCRNCWRLFRLKEIPQDECS